MRSLSHSSVFHSALQKSRSRKVAELCMYWHDSILLRSYPLLAKAGDDIHNPETKVRNACIGCISRNYEFGLAYITATTLHRWRHQWSVATPGRRRTDALPSGLSGGLEIVLGCAVLDHRVPRDVVLDNKRLAARGLSRTTSQTTASLVDCVAI